MKRSCLGNILHWSLGCLVRFVVYYPRPLKFRGESKFKFLPIQTRNANEFFSLSNFTSNFLCYSNCFRILRFLKTVLRFFAIRYFALVGKFLFLYPLPTSYLFIDGDVREDGVHAPRFREHGAERQREARHQQPRPCCAYVREHVDAGHPAV